MNDEQLNGWLFLILAWSGLCLFLVPLLGIINGESFWFNLFVGISLVFVMVIFILSVFPSLIMENDSGELDIPERYY